MIWIRERYIEKWFWTLGELLDSSKEPWQLSNNDILAIANAMTGYSTPMIVSATWKDSNVSSVLDLIIKRFNDEYCYSTYENNLTTRDKNVFVMRLINILEMTYGKYSKLLSVYSSIDSNLLAKINTHSDGVSKFNDTPQDSGDFDTDTHLSNITRQETDTGTDGDTPMGRVAEIQEKYDNILLRWSNEFESLFMEGGNI